MRTLGEVLFRCRSHFLVDVAVVALVLSLPLSLRAPLTATTQEPSALAAAADIDGPRAETVSRGGTISAAIDTRTTVADDVRPIPQYTLGANDSLQSLANFFKVSAEAIAFSNGITDPRLGDQQGRTILIPPGEGALYTVKESDTVESVAARFKVDPKAIMGYNRLYFEPEHFAPGQLIFVPGAAVPGLVYAAADPEEEVQAPIVLARPEPVVAAPTGRLPWPVGGRITQYFWAFHNGVDIAARYGTGVAASAFGTVVSTGWVPVGGLSVRIRHGNDFETGYYHLGAVFVAPGQKVWPGQIIGTVGMTGVTSGPHVHWEVKLIGGSFVNPLTY